MCPHALNFGQRNTGGNVRAKQEGTSVGSISGKSMNAAAIVWEREGYGGVAVGDAGCRAVGGGGEEKGGVAALTKKALPLIKIACVLIKCRRPKEKAVCHWLTGNQKKSPHIIA